MRIAEQLAAGLAEPLTEGAVDVMDRVFQDIKKSVISELETELKGLETDLNGVAKQIEGYKKYGVGKTVHKDLLLGPVMESWNEFETTVKHFGDRFRALEAKAKEGGAAWG